MQLSSDVLSLVNCAANEQLTAKHSPDEVRDSYALFIAATNLAFQNIPVTVWYSPIDTYKTSRALFEAIDNGSFNVFTGGQPLPYNHSMTTNDNAKFRAVHDYFGHYKNKLSFSTLAELKVAAKQTKMLPVNALDALLCETVLQTSVYYVTGQFAEQKAFKVSDTLKSQWQQFVLTS